MKRLITGLAIMVLLLTTILANSAIGTEPTIIGDCAGWTFTGAPGDILDSNDPAVSGRTPGIFPSPYDGTNGELRVVILFDGNTAESGHVGIREPECPPETSTTTTTSTTTPTTSSSTTTTLSTTTTTVSPTTITVTTVPPSTTTTPGTPSTTTSSIPPSSTVPPTTVTTITDPPPTTTQPPELPHTGLSTSYFGGAGLALLTLGSILAWLYRREEMS